MAGDKRELTDAERREIAERLAKQRETTQPEHGKAAPRFG